MQTTYSLFSTNIELYKSIRDILDKPIIISKLPIISESKIFKMSAERYGHIILKLDLETEREILNYNPLGCSYSWDVDENYQVEEDKRFPSHTILPISKEYFETEILNEIKLFTNLFRLMNDDITPLRFSVIGGSHKINERSYFGRVTAEALIQLFRRLNE